MSLNLFLQNVANGLSLGSLYALIAIGYTMVYGILRLINFAHGEIFMLAPYFLYFGVLIFHSCHRLNCHDRDVVRKDCL